jgi:hypothetical protein
MGFLVVAAGIGALVGAGVYFVMKAERARTAALRALAERLGWSFREEAGVEVIPDAERFELFTQGHTRKVRNFMAGSVDGVKAAVFDYAYTTGGGKNQTTWQQTVACVHTREMDLPLFSLRPETFFHRIGQLFGYQDIDLERRPVFSDAYLLRGTDEAAVRAAFAPMVTEFFEARQKLCATGAGPVLYLWRTGGRVKPEGVEALLAEAAELAGRFRQVPSSQVASDM